MSSNTVVDHQSGGQDRRRHHSGHRENLQSSRSAPHQRVHRTGRRALSADRSQDALPPACSGGGNQPSQTLTFDAGKSKAPNLKEGDARLVVEADSDDFAGHTDTASAAVKVILAPPRVAPDDAQHYINQGGMELAVMTPGGIVDRGGREGRQIHLPQFPPAGPPGAALRHVRVSLGPAGQPDAHGVRAQRRPARKPPRNSGSSCFRRSSAYAIFRSMTR